MATSTHISAPRGILFSQMAASFHALRELVSKRRDFRRTVNELSRLNARQLDDLGLNRFDLRQVAFDAVYTPHH